MHCQQCGRNNPAQVHVCMTCGAQLCIVCPRCAAQLPLDPHPRFCFACGARLEGDRPAPDESETAAGDRRQVTVLFADLADWTQIAAAMDPEDVQAIQRAYFAAVTPPIEQHGGSVEKYIGDAVLAIFGAPHAHEDDPERAVRAALAMQGALGDLNRRLEGAGGETPPLRLRIGVHTGLVVSLVGAGGDFVVTGDTVNLASRLQSAAEPGTVLVSADTARLVTGVFHLADLGAILVKGKAEPIPVFRVAGFKATPAKLRGLAGMDSQLIGRQAEMAALSQVLERLARGVGAVITVVGEAGIGKSRLVAELHKLRPPADQQLPAIDHRSPITVNWIEGRCLSYGGSIAYLLWLDLLRSALGCTLDDSPETVRDMLRQWVERLCPDCVADVYPYLVQLMALPLPPEIAAIIADLEGEELKRRTFQAVDRVIAVAATRQPLVIICEDLHWADPSSLALLEHVLALTNKTGLLVVGVFRPELEHGVWRLRETIAREYHLRHTDLWLQPLSADESETLVGNLLSANLAAGDQELQSIPSRLIWRILAQAEGNPFYVEEALRALIDGGVLARDAAGRWTATRDVAEIELPGTLQGVLMARIDRLPENTRRLLQLAAVIGRIFPYRMLAEIAQEEQTLDEKLLTLQHEALIRERARIPELEYIFKHELTREAAYNSILKHQRRLFHRQVAEALERLFPDRVDEMAGLLAHHWERTGNTDKAVGYLIQAGEYGRFAYALQEAADFYQRALALLGEDQTPDRQASILAKLAMIYRIAGDTKQSHAAFDRSFMLWQRAVQIHRHSESAWPPAVHPLRFPAEEPERLCPITSQGGHTWRLLYHLFRGLNRRSPLKDSTALPDVASAWEVSEDGRRYLFHLRKNVRWSDGARVSAGDFEYGMRRRLDPAAGAALASALDGIGGARAFRLRQEIDPGSVGVHALDDSTLAVELEARLDYFPYLVADLPTYPAPRHVIERYGQAWTDPEHLVTNGPFRFEDWQPGVSMMVTLDANYDLPIYGNVQQVQMSFVSDPKIELAMYESDLLDCIELSGLSISELDCIRRRHPEEYVPLVDMLVAYLVLSTTATPFDDPRVRRAFAHAVDLEKLATEILHGYDQPALGGLFPPGFPGYAPGIVLPYDPEQAQALLAAAGCPAGRGFPVVELLAPGAPGTTGMRRRSGFNIPMVEYLVNQWRHVLKVEVNAQLLTPRAFRARLLSSPPPISLATWGPAYPDPDCFLGEISSLDLSHDPQYEQLIAEARAEVDHRQRMALYHTAHQHLVTGAAIIPLVYPAGQYLLKPWFRYGIGGRYWQDFVLLPH